MCWYCYWGWPKPIAEIYQRAVALLGGDVSPMESGPGHVVWSDCNWDSAQWCLDHFDEYRGDYSDADLAIVRRSLEELVKLDLDAIDPVPEDFEEDFRGTDPYSKYPPTKEVVKI